MFSLSLFSDIITYSYASTFFTIAVKHIDDVRNKFIEQIQTSQHGIHSKLREK